MVAMHMVQISDVEGALVRTFLSPAHMRAASLVGTQLMPTCLCCLNCIFHSRHPVA